MEGTIELWTNRFFYTLGGGIKDYGEVEAFAREYGMSLQCSREEHEWCSEMENW